LENFVFPAPSREDDGAPKVFIDEVLARHCGLTDEENDRLSFSF
jgi:hypothetical protein